MTVYLDVVLLENLCMNYIILFATAYILKIKIKHGRLFLSSLIGSLYAILGYMQILEIYSNTILKIILSIVMVYLAYNAKHIKILLKQILIFYLTSFVFGGCAFALLYFVKPQEILMKNGMYIGTYPLKIALLGGIVGFTITAIAFKVVKNRISKKDMFCEICIEIEKQSVKTKAMIDTGNMLKDPLTGMPVAVVEKEVLQEIIPKGMIEHLEKWMGGEQIDEEFRKENIEYMSKLRVIPFSSLGKQNGMLIGLKANRVILEKEEEEEEIKNMIIGIYDKPFSKKGNYHALIGLDIWEGSRKDEYITNVSE